MYKTDDLLSCLSSVKVKLILSLFFFFAPNQTAFVFAQTESKEKAPLTQKAEFKVDQIEFSESEQIISDEALWNDEGLRVDLAYIETRVQGLNPSPSGLIQGIQIGLGTRLDSTWSLSTALVYGVGSEGLSGLNFSGHLSAIYHWYGVGFGLEVGLVGVDEREGARSERYPGLANEIVDSYTLTDSTAPLSYCSGFGPLTGLTLLYRLPLSTVFGLKLGTRLNRARLSCEQETDRVEPDQAQAIMIRQYWDRWSWSLFGGLTWR